MNQGEQHKKKPGRFHEEDNSRTVTHPIGWGTYLTPGVREPHPEGNSVTTRKAVRAALPLEDKRESNKPKSPRDPEIF